MKVSSYNGHTILVLKFLCHFLLKFSTAQITLFGLELSYQESFEGKVNLSCPEIN